MTELSSGADRNGFNPFPGAGRFPSADFFPGPLSAWRPLFTNVQIAYNYGTQRYVGIKDRTDLKALGDVGIGDRV